ncbi:hypothetical protein [Synechococcus phage BUCT-ZZ01]|nr:hypothetical protein [Synechococcus phage BUCT-ZZ01]
MLETLIAAKQLIEDEKNWCRVERAKDKKGRYVEPTNRSACQFCAVGAVQKVMSYDQIDVYTSQEVKFLDIISRNMYGQPVFIINDDLGHGYVLKIFDKAIEQLKEREVLC